MLMVCVDYNIEGLQHRYGAFSFREQLYYEWMSFLLNRHVVAACTIEYNRISSVECLAYINSLNAKCIYDDINLPHHSCMVWIIITLITIEDDTSAILTIVSNLIVIKIFEHIWARCKHILCVQIVTCWYLLLQQPIIRVSKRWRSDILH